MVVDKDFSSEVRASVSDVAVFRIMSKITPQMIKIMPKVKQIVAAIMDFLLRVGMDCKLVASKVADCGLNLSEKAVGVVTRGCVMALELLMILF